MEAWFRRYNYIEDYYWTLYKLYSNVYPAYPVTYYSLDFENSTLDRKYLNAGSYEKLGVGELSGVLWRKVLMLPVFGIEQIQPSQNTGEKGLTYHETMTSQIILPSVYKFKPIENDMVDLNFGIKDVAIKNQPLFTITNVNMASHGNYLNFYQCQVRVAPFYISDLETQISSYWMFLDHEKKIYPLENTQVLLKLEEKVKTITNDLNKFFNQHVGVYSCDEVVSLS
ncbi:MAG: hypothetical protein ACOCQD_01615 [archaeon]